MATNDLVIQALNKTKLDTRAFASIVQRKLALLLLRELVFRTPVRTGRARGNWIVSIGQPVTETLAEGATNAEKAMSDGTAKLSEPSQIPFATIFIQNNLPYILPLDRGHSKQAPDPPGIVEPAIALVSSLTSVTNAE